MNILGISCYFHDSAACLLKDGILVAAAEEERFTRKKHDNSFPINAINYCLKEGKIIIDDVDVIGFYDKSFLKFDRIIQTCVETFPRSFWLFCEAVPEWLTEKLRVPSILKNELGYNGEVIFIEHHKSHAASAFLVSPFNEAAIVTVDAIGEWASTAIHQGINNEIKTIEEINFPHSLGLFYSTITAYLGFKVLNDEYKVMGLAAWGKPIYREKFKKLIDIKDDGSFELNMDYFSYTYKNRMFSDKIVELFGPPRIYTEKLTKKHMNIAATLQELTEDVMLKIVNHAHELTGSRNLCMAGGVALNSVSNGKILREGPFERIWIQPASTDSGGAVGVATYIYSTILNHKRKYRMRDVFLGPGFGNEEIENFLKRKSIKYKKLKRKELLKKTAELLSDGKIVGWVQGRMEFGPRALGNRSILANPRNPKMKDIINKKVKHREWFRPFAPSILLDKANEYLDRACEAPFMVITFDVKKNKRREIISATHIDWTARVQTVSRKRNKLYYDLIKEFEKKTGVAAVLNTSFNVRGEPIVCTPEDAYNCFKNTDIDYLVLGTYLIGKKLI